MPVDLKNKRWYKIPKSKIPGYKNIVKYIKNEYFSADKIVEIGVGNHPEILTNLSNEIKGKVIGVDIDPSPQTTYDNISFPNMSIYDNADLIYSIRPPIEIQKDIVNVCKIEESDLIIRPLMDEVVDLNKYFKRTKLVSLKDNSLYIGKD